MLLPGPFMKINIGTYWPVTINSVTWGKGIRVCRRLLDYTVADPSGIACEIEAENTAT